MVFEGTQTKKASLRSMRAVQQQLAVPSTATINVVDKTEDEKTGILNPHSKDCNGFPSSLSLKHENDMLKTKAQIGMSLCWP